MVISTRPCSLDSAGGGVSTAGLLLQRCQQTEALRRCTLVLDLIDAPAASPGRFTARSLLGTSRGRRRQAREAAPDRLPLRERGRADVLSR
jgi:hypothetical protein